MNIRDFIGVYEGFNLGGVGVIKEFLFRSSFGF